MDDGITQKIASRVSDYEELIRAANEGLALALRDGAKHEPGSWAHQSIGEHFNHLTAHLRKLQNGIEKGDRNENGGEDHLSHVICRAVMIRALRCRRWGE